MYTTGENIEGILVKLAKAYESIDVGILSIQNPLGYIWKRINVPIGYYTIQYNLRRLLKH